MNQRSGARGFTLIEVMVALSIFAVLAVTLLTRMGDNIRSEEYLQSKTLAAMIAENRLNELRLAKNWNALTDKMERIDYAGQSWNVQVNVTDTPNENFRKVDVQVGPDLAWSRDDSPIFTLTSYIGKY